MIFYCALSIGRVFSATIKTCPNVHQVHNFVLTIEMSINMQNNEQTEYKTVRGLTRGLMLLNMLNKLDGGASVGLLAELSGLHRTTVRRLLETLQEEGYVRRSPSDDSFRLTIKVRQLSEGFRDEQWISALAAPLLGDLLREVVWPTDVSTLDVDAMVVRETTHRFSRLSFHRAMVGRRLPLLKTASGLTWLAFCPEQERKELIEMLKIYVDGVKEENFYKKLSHDFDIDSRVLEAKRRIDIEQNKKINEKSEQESIFSRFFPPVRILIGEKVVNIFEEESGKIVFRKTSMQHINIEYEIPLDHILSPLDFQDTLNFLLNGGAYETNN